MLFLNKKRKIFHKFLLVCNWEVFFMVLNTQKFSSRNVQFWGRPTGTKSKIWKMVRTSWMIHKFKCVSNPLFHEKQSFKNLILRMMKKSEKNFFSKYNNDKKDLISLWTNQLTLFMDSMNLCNTFFPRINYTHWFIPLFIHLFTTPQHNNDYKCKKTI